MDPTPVTARLTVSGIWKSYTTVVLEDVNFELRAGEVHALVGENGAGKSTLSRIMAGLTPPDQGTLTLNGQPYAPKTKADAEHQGVRMVLQELNVLGTLTVAENIFIDKLPHRLGWIDYARLNTEARQVMDRVGLAQTQPDQLVSSLGVGQQQLVEIAAGLSRQCQVLILDEPTASLTDPEIDLLFRQIQILKTAGVGIVYISHRLEEIKRVADRITVLRDGQIVANREVGSVDMEEIVRLMVGRDLPQESDRSSRENGKIALRVENLCRGRGVQDVSFTAYAGEILGFAGLMGSGRTELLRVIFGADPLVSGRIFLHNSMVPARIASPRDAVQQGVALLTEDRKEQGLLLGLPIRMNISLTHVWKMASRLGWLRRPEERSLAASWIQQLAIKCSGPEQPVLQLSGGNQQKVVMAKWLFRDCDIIMVDEPTRGIDVGAKFEIYELLHRLARQNKAIIVVSSDLKELLALCDRIAVMSAGQLAATFKRGEWTQDKIMSAALSGYTGKTNAFACPSA